MGFRMNKVAAAVTATLGVTLAGIGSAQADEILFPYVVTSDTVTTIVSTINAVDIGATNVNVAPPSLHYKYWYKAGADAEKNASVCQEVNRPLPSSANDVVTFDVSAGLGADNLGILFENAADAVNVNPNLGYGKATFGLLGGITQPVRSFLVVDNNDFTTGDAAAETFFRTGSSLAGEAIILEFANGAAWGYAAYNSAARFDANGFRINFNDFSDYVETAGEVIAGENGLGFVPVVLHPPVAPNGGLVTKFFVTPIRPSTWDGTAWVPPPATLTTGGQLVGNLATQVRLVIQDASLGTGVMYDRDEGPVSGQVAQSVVCVGAVDAQSMLTEGARQQLPNGGWSNLVVESPTPSAALLPTPEAIVIKLEYNTPNSTSFPAVGVVNNAIWLRKGIKESIPPSASFGANGSPIFTPRLTLGTFGFDENVTKSTAGL